MGALLTERVSEHARENPGKAALVYRGGTMDYKGLEGSFRSLAAGLGALGVQPGDRVALQLLNVPEFVVAYLGILAMGGIVVPINPIYKSAEIELILSDSGARVLITTPEFAKAVDPVRSKLPALENVVFTGAGWAGLLDGGRGRTPPEPPRGSDVAEIIYTSGTTGRPKGAMLTHDNLYTNALGFADELKVTARERTLIVAPMFHIAAQTCCLNTTLVAGGTCHLLPKWGSAEEALGCIQQHRITFFFGPPTMYTFMLNSPRLGEFDLGSMRVAFTGAAPLPVKLFNRWREVVGFEIVEGYGLSETSPVVCINPYEGTKKPGSIGLPLKGVDARVFGPDEKELPTGEVGEIVVRGPNVMKGYWSNPQATAEAMKGGWFHTGDLACRDAEGYFFIVDRKKDMVIRGGLNVYPREVEEVVYTHPKVLEAAVVGVPDEVMGEEVKAFVTLKPGESLDPEEVRAHCRERLADYKVPRFVELVESLPKTATGKVLKGDLRKRGRAGERAV